MASIVTGGLGTIGAWASATVSGGSDSTGAVAWSESLERAVCITGATAGTNDFAYSDDGINWTNVSTGLTNRAWRTVVWVDAFSLFVATSTPNALDTQSNSIATSPDGVTWTARTTPSETGASSELGWANLAASATRVVVVPTPDPGPYTSVLISTNGTTYTETATSGAPERFLAIAYSSTLSLFVAVGRTNTLADLAVYSSPDGETWTVRYTQAADASTAAPSIAWAAGLGMFVISRPGYEGVLTSTNGTAWSFTAFAGGASAFVVWSLAWSESRGVFIAVGDGSGVGDGEDFLYSTDGLSWTLTADANVYASSQMVWCDALGLMLVGEGLQAFGGLVWRLGITAGTDVSVTGLDHLEGESVSVIADGVVIASPNNAEYAPIVVTNGTIDLPAGTYTRVVVGLPYTTDIQTLDIDGNSPSIKDRGINVKRIGLWMEESVPPFAGKDQPTTDAPTNMQRMPQEDEDQNATASPITGYREVQVDGAFSNSGRIFLRQVDPSPLTVLAIVPQFDSGR